MLVVLGLVIWRLWSAWYFERSLQFDAELDHEFYMTMATLRWGGSVVGWACLAYGLWVTAKARDSALLHWGARLYGVQVVAATAIGMGLRAEAIDPQAQWLSYTHAAVQTLILVGSLCIVLHARRGSADAVRTTLVAALHIASFVVALWTLFGLSGSPLLQAQWLDWALLMAWVLPWISWLLLPSDDFRLGGSTPSDRSLERGATSPQRDLAVGFAWAGAGLLLTLVSFTGDGIGGRAVLAWGPIAYGAIRVIRGLSRRDAT